MYKLSTMIELLNQGQAFAYICSALNVVVETYQRWQHFCDGMKATEAELLKDPNLGNATLKRLLSNA